jgi:4-hydroxyphenylpyruvate dioxygenase
MEEQITPYANDLVHRVPRQPGCRRIFCRLNGTDYVEFYVGNAKQAAHFYRAAFGMKLAAYRGPETGTRDRASYVLAAGQDPAGADHAARACIGHRRAHVRLHGDGVRDIALWVDDAESAWRETTKRGARGVREPETLRDEHGEVRISAIATYGDTIHTFVERRNYRGASFPARLRAGGKDDAGGAARWAASTSTTWWATSAGAR